MDTKKQNIEREVIELCANTGMILEAIDRIDVSEDIEHATEILDKAFQNQDSVRLLLIDPDNLTQRVTRNMNVIRKNKETFTLRNYFLKSSGFLPPIPKGCVNAGSYLFLFSPSEANIFLLLKKQLDEEQSAKLT